VSTILKALRRLEEEKTRGGSGRPLREEIASGPSEQPRRRRLTWLPLAAMVIGAGIGASAWYVWPYYERAAEPLGADVAAAPALPAPAAPAASAALPAAPPVVTPPSEPAQLAPQDQPPQEIADQIAALQQEDAAPPEEAFASQVEVIDRPTPTPRIEPVAPPPLPAVAPPAVAQPPRVAQEPQHGLPEPAGLIARRAASEADAPAKPAAAKPAKAAKPAPPPDASDWEEPSEPEPAPARVGSTREPEPEPRPVAAAAPAAPAPAPAPAVHVRRTQWHPDKTRRSAEVELGGKSESVREGDVVGEYVVTEIRPSGVVWTRDGEKIETKIGK
jgi:hypothetical protein